METKELDKKYFAREKLSIDIEPVDASGSFMIDSSGHRYIDFLMGWCVGNTGWANEAIEEAIRMSIHPTYVYPGMLYRPWAELAEMLAGITPGKLNKSFRTTGGTEAVETAMQIAMLYTGRSKFISIEGSYHGNSLATLSIGDSEGTKKFGNKLRGCKKISVPLDHRSIKKAETMLKKKDIAAFIMEPVICNLGVIVPEKEFMKELGILCKKYGTLLVMDEVATGFGRTGKMFATEHFEIEPDIITMAKAITGGYAGLGATITTEQIGKAVEHEINIYSSYGWHPLSVEAAIANIRYIRENKRRLLGNVLKMEEVFRSRLMQMKFRKPATVRIIGLAIGIDTGDADYAKKIMSRCLKNRLLVNAEDTRIAMYPSLTIDTETAERGLDIFEDTLREIG